MRRASLRFRDSVFILLAAVFSVAPAQATVMLISHVDEDPSSPTLVREGSTATLTVTGPAQPLSYIWEFEGFPVAGSAGRTLTLTGLTPAQSGNYEIAAHTWNSDPIFTNTVTLNVLSPAQLATVPAAAEIVASEDFPPLASAVTLTPRILSGEGPFTYEWLALDYQPLPPDRFSRELKIANITHQHYGRYQVRITNPHGVATLSRVYDLRHFTPPPFVALSGRAVAGPGEATLIAGVTVASSSLLTSSPLFRGVGPSLRSLGVSDVLDHPVLSVHVPTRTPVSATGWTYDGRQYGAFALQPGSNDAVTRVRQFSGNATIHLTSADGSVGVALLEIYHTPTEVPFRRSDELLHLSFRARTGPGEATAIAGFVIDDHLLTLRPKRVLLRALGPALAAQGIADPLPNPILTLYNVRGEPIAQNDNWSDAADLSALTDAMNRSGLAAFPANSKDAALLLDLPAGAYTMHATGGTGVVLLEIYSVP